MLKIIKVAPENNKSLRCIYSEIKNECDFREDLSFDLVDRCRNSIYAALDVGKGIPHLIAVIGCSKILMEEAGIDDLAYHCDQANKVYSIDFLHLALSCKCQNRSIYEDELLSYLLKETMADKNDTFTIYRPSCVGMENLRSKKALVNNGFKPCHDDDKSNELDLVYVRPPQLQAVGEI